MKLCFTTNTGVLCKKMVELDKFELMKNELRFAIKYLRGPENRHKFFTFTLNNVIHYQNYKKFKSRYPTNLICNVGF